MADFLSNLWASVFTPGTTPTLLVATNATFAALQVLLLALLAATYSIHFAILSVLCGGLWYSINWFATELSATKAQEELRQREKSDTAWRKRGEVDDSADDEGEATEGEDRRTATNLPERTSSLRKPTMKDDEKLKEEIMNAMEASGRNNPDSVVATGAQMEVEEGGKSVRRREEMDRSGEISTDSEWEKVEQ